ncbi:MAG: pyruvate, phosphate dikinase [Gemmatimonadetes bacterium]|nr:pyruvate, phosphate dikinase [Gemmatimonadota bacterium]
MTDRLVYSFGGGHADGGRGDKAILGSKGAGLAEMTRIGVPVPPGFTITTEACRFYLRENDHPPGLQEQVALALERLERETGKRFGAMDRPLLVSVRSGAAVSMPGMMETILNLGLNDWTVEALAKDSGDARFAWDSYRRFVQMFGEVVLAADKEMLDAIFDAAKARQRIERDTDLDETNLREVVAAFKTRIRASTGEPFPDDPFAQLWRAIEAVYRSWSAQRAIAYRRVHGIPDYLGTAVSIVAMVYGNMGEDSGTGVVFTRNPSTGAREFFGEFLLNAQGEDVVAGIRTPVSISEMATRLPDAYASLLDVQKRLENHFRDMQDLEFTVERGQLYLLQTRTGKRTAAAAIRIAVDMVDEGLIDETEAVLRVDPRQLDQLLHPRIDPRATADELAAGLPASPGAAAGRIVFDPDEAVGMAAGGDPVILVRRETSPDDFAGMVAARAVVTARGGMTSHAAVVARGMGKCCVVGAHALEIDARNGVCRASGREVRAGDWITVDGTSGRIFVGNVPTVDPDPTDDFHRLMAWADRIRVLGVRANADTPADARKARELGAEGIGLCRTEHMFFEGERIHVVREMILARTAEDRRQAIDRLLPMQREDFCGIFRAMQGLPVTIRLLDPPLHEFLPSGDEIRHFAEIADIDVAAVRRALELHREANPMLGHRGVRLSISYPEIAEMQTRAIFEAAVAIANEGIAVRPEVMIPLVSTEPELQRMRKIVTAIADSVLEAAEVRLRYLVGTMIELPRAALLAAEIARHADFFSFGTNDLTQTTYGISRDDAASFLPRYIEDGIFPDDPFQVLDREGVGQLVQMATWEGRQRKPDLKVGICGEHGGDPGSIEFFHETGLDYVSCSPFRVPIARLAAAHATLNASVPRRKALEARAKRAEADATERLRQIRRTEVLPPPPGRVAPGIRLE